MPINIVLYQPEIPQNTGNIMRTCAGTNVKLHLIKPLGFSLDQKAVRRSGANYVEHTDYVVYENFEDFKTKNPGSYYISTRYGTHVPTEFDFSDSDEDIYIIFGSESSGIPKEILLDYKDTCFRLPMNDKIRSLNLSNCAAIMIYEALRQQNYNDLLVDEPFKVGYLEK